MIRIVKDGVDLDLGDIRLRWELPNSVFETEVIQNDFTFPFTLPISSVNMKAFNFINLPQVTKQGVKFNVDFFYEEISVSAILIITGIKKNGFTCNIAAGLSALKNADKSLKELVYNSGNPINIPNFNNLTAYETVNWKNAIAFPPHYNPDFYGDSNPDFCGVVNRQNGDDRSYLTNTIYTGNKYTFVPFVYLHYILKTIFDAENLTILGSYWNHPDFASLLVYNNYALDKLNPVGLFSQTSYSGGLGGLVVIVPFTQTAGSGFDNLTHKYPVAVSGNYTFNLTLQGSIYFPAATIYNSVLYIRYETGGVVSTDIFEVVLSSFMMLTPFSINLTATASLVQFDRVWVEVVSANIFVLGLTSATFNITLDPVDVNYHENNISINNHVPDITVSDFLNKLKRLAEVDFNLDWNNNTVYLKFIENTLKADVECDFTPFADPYPEQLLNKGKGYTVNYDFGSNDDLLNNNFKQIDANRFLGDFQAYFFPLPSASGQLARCLSTNQVFQSKPNGSFGFQWEYIGDYYYPQKVNNGKTDYKIEFAPLFMTFGSPAVNEGTGLRAITLMPQIKQKGSSPAFDLGLNDAGLRVVFFRGVYNDPYWGGTHVVASSGTFGLSGDVIGAQNLKLDGDDGIFTRYIKNILTIIDNNEIFEYKINLPASYLRFRNKIHLDGVNWLIKNVSVSFAKSIKQSVVKLLKL
jgi:hypothetical protein